MHDYFCHGSKLLAVTPEVFVHLCNQDIFAHTSKQDTTNVIKDYVQNLKTNATEVSQDIVKELYTIAECNGTANIDSLFEDWLEDSKKPRTKCGSKAIYTDKTYNQNVEILLIRDKESNTDINLIGWLSTASKWIKLASVNLTSLGCSSLGKFVGFAHDSMAFENPSKLIIIPFHADQPWSIASGCGNACTYINNNACNHFYFSAWNDLFCIYPETECQSREGDDSYDDFWDSFDEDDRSDLNTIVIVQYKVTKFSRQNNTWKDTGNLDLPDDYNDIDDLDFDTLAYAGFQISMNDKHVFLMVYARHENLITVLQLTQDATGKLKFQQLFHSSDMSSPFGYNSHILVKSTPTKLRFQTTSSSPPSWREPLNTTTLPTTQITEVNTKTKKTKNIKLKAEKVNFPEGIGEEFRTLKRNVYRYTTSKLSGLLFYIDAVMPYVTALWSYDPLKNEWKSLPAPPLDGLIDAPEIHYFPARLLPNIKASPSSIFEDKHDNPKHGPLKQSKSERK